MYVGPTPGSQAAVALNQAKQAQSTQQLQQGLQLLQAAKTTHAQQTAGGDHDGDSDSGKGGKLDITV